MDNNEILKKIKTVCNKAKTTVSSMVEKCMGRNNSTETDILKDINVDKIATETPVDTEEVSWDQEAKARFIEYIKRTKNNPAFGLISDRSGTILRNMPPERFTTERYMISNGCCVEQSKSETYNFAGQCGSPLVNKNVTYEGIVPVKNGPKSQNIYVYLDCGDFRWDGNSTSCITIESKGKTTRVLDAKQKEAIYTLIENEFKTAQAKYTKEQSESIATSQI